MTKDFSSSAGAAPTVTRERVRRSLSSAPIVGVVRTTEAATAEALANAYIAAGLELIEITFTVPGTGDLIRRLLEERGHDGPPWIGAGTVTNTERAKEALDNGAEFLVTPNVDADVAAAAQLANIFLVIGALTATEICTARKLGADIVKVYPLPPVGGPAYLEIVREPLGDIPMLAAGGFDVDEIPAYLAAGATAFGIGAQLLGGDDPATQRNRIRAALAAARGEQ